MPGKRPPPRGAPKGKGAAPHSESAAPSKGKPAAAKGKGGAAAKSQARPGVPQAAIDASNAARRAGLGSVARKGASEVVSPRKGAAPERNAPPRWTGDEWTDEGDVRQEARGRSRAGHDEAPGEDRQP